MSFFTSKDSKLFCNTKLHFVLTNRHDGVSLPPYDSLNLAYHVGDLQENVGQNRANIMQKYYKNKTLLYLNQIHSNTIFTINHANKHIDSMPHSYNLVQTKSLLPCRLKSQRYLQYSEVLVGQGDGIICNDLDLVLMSMVADCNPILVYSPLKRVFALLHAGRLGVCKKILTHAIILLKRYYAVDLCDILVFMGASIRKCCYVIGRDLAMQIINDFGARHVICGDNYRLDMIGLLLDELSECGISSSQVEIHGGCTCCDESYFSYRRSVSSSRNLTDDQYGLTGRFALFASLS